MSLREFDSCDGALLIDKPAGPTSHDVVDAIRHCYRIKKVGHCGTLDPLATGLLILLLGRATKLSEKLMADDKIYEGSLRLGCATNSFDGAGEPEKEMPVPDLDLDHLNQHATVFLGDQMQKPPMVSAVKVDGVPLYKLARKGIEVERKERFIHVYTFQFTKYEAPLAWFTVACTKGAYVRTLAHDFGRELGCGAHLAGLRRTISGNFSANDAIPMEALPNTTPEMLQRKIIPMLQLAKQGTSKK